MMSPNMLQMLAKSRGEKLLKAAETDRLLRDAASPRDGRLYRLRRHRGERLD